MACFSGIAKKPAENIVLEAKEILIGSLFSAPLFVVIITAPLAPRFPYRAEAVAPFNTLMDSISSATTSLIVIFAYGTPSMTINGLSPRIARVGTAAKSVEFFTNNPATFPVKEVETSTPATFCKLSLFTFWTE